MLFKEGQKFVKSPPISTTDANNNKIIAFEHYNFAKRSSLFPMAVFRFLDSLKQKRNTFCKIETLNIAKCPSCYKDCK